MEENQEEPSLQHQQATNNALKQNLPNATAVLVLGILSIVFCFCYGFIGITLGIIALIMGNKDLKIYKTSPNLYTETSYKNIKTGKTCAIIGLCLSSFYILVVAIYIAVVGLAVGGGLLHGLSNFGSFI